MKRTTLLAIAIGMSIIGIVIVALANPQVDPQDLAITGMVKSVHDKGKITFITFIPEDFSVVSFEPKVSEGKHTLHGHLQEYDGKVEFVIDSVD